MLGIDAYFGYNSGTYNSPTWVEVTCIGEANFNMPWKSAEVEVRATRATLTEKTTLPIEFTGKMLTSTAGADYVYMRDLINSNDSADFLILTNSPTVVGAWGVRFRGQVHSANQDQGPQAILNNEISVKPCIPTDGNYPKYAEVESGPALAYTALGTSRAS